ncbi:MAG: outer membrane beta-barrel protein [Pseudomonadota bacterium]
MRNRSLLLVSAAVIGLSLPAQAQQTEGFFIEGQGGVNWLEDIDVFPGSVAIPGLEATIGSASFDTGWAASGQVGYGFGNGLILEGEVTYRSNDGDLPVSGRIIDVEPTPFRQDYQFDVESWAFMANVLYEFNPVAGVHPYVGAGIGAAIVDAEVRTPGGIEVSDDDTGFAAQAIAGLRIPFTPQLSAVVDYRFFNVFDIEFDEFGGFIPGVPSTVQDDLMNHTVMAGLRYTFAPPPPPPPPPAPIVAPVAETAFIVFFDWDRADLTPEANLVLDDVVVVANQSGYASIRLDGYTDLSGSAQYNLGLSERRANSVADGLIARGIAPDEIVIRAFGEENPLVPTPDGVREPQNRRVEIFLT